MGLMAADLERHRSRLTTKTASERPMVRTEPKALTVLEMGLDRYAGAIVALEKSASIADPHRNPDDDHQKLWSIHEDVEKCYRMVCKEGRRIEANKLIDKYAGWAYLKGQPGEPGDLHPLPAPDEK